MDKIKTIFAGIGSLLFAILTGVFLHTRRENEKLKAENEKIKTEKNLADIKDKHQTDYQQKINDLYKKTDSEIIEDWKKL